MSRKKKTKKLQTRTGQTRGVDATRIIEGAFRSLLREGQMPEQFKAVVLINTKTQTSGLAACRFRVLWNEAEKEIWIMTPEVVEAEGRDCIQTTFKNDDAMFPDLIAWLKAEDSNDGPSGSIDGDQFSVVPEGPAEGASVVGMFRAEYSNGLASLIHLRFAKPHDGMVPEAVAKAVVERAREAESPGGRLTRVTIGLGGRQIYP